MMPSGIMSDREALYATSNTVDTASSAKITRSIKEAEYSIFSHLQLLMLCVVKIICPPLLLL